MGHRVAPIHHSRSSLTSLRSEEKSSRLGEQKIEVRLKKEEGCEIIGFKVIERHLFPLTHTYC